MNKSLAKKVQQETSKRLASARKRIENNRMTAIAIRGTTAVVTGAALGEAERRGISPVIMGTVPLRGVIGVMAAFGEAFTRGAASAALSGVASASLGVYGYEASQKRTFIAGTHASSTRTYV